MTGRPSFVTPPRVRVQVHRELRGIDPAFDLVPCLKRVAVIRFRILKFLGKRSCQDPRIQRPVPSRAKSRDLFLDGRRTNRAAVGGFFGSTNDVLLNRARIEASSRSRLAKIPF